MLGLAALVLALFSPVLIGRVFYHRDIHLQWQPQIEAAVRAVAHGSWPVWDPSVGFGQPLLANPNLQLLYPPTWLNLVVRPWTFYTLLVIAHFLLAGVGTYRLALACRLSRMGAFLAAALWIAGGPFVSLVDLWNHLCGAAWIPWSALCALRIAEGGRLRWACTWGATVAAPILAGSPETALMAAGVGVVLALPALPRARTEGRLAAVFLHAVAAAMLAVLLSAAQWLPSLALARASTRAHMPEAFRAFWSLHPAVLLEALFPVALDRLPLHWEVRGALFEHREPFLASLYVGLATLALVAAALRRPTATKALLAALVLGALALALGRHLPVYALAVKLLPPLQWLRFPAKLLVVAGLAWALLAGMGFDAWQGDGGRRPRAVLVAVLGLSVLGAMGVAALAAFGAEEWGSALLFRGESLRSFTEILAPSARHVARAGLAAAAVLGVVFAAPRPWSRGRAPLALLMVVLADLVAAQAGVQPTTTADLYRYRPAAVEVARPAPGQRVFAYDYFVPGAGLRHLGHRASYLTAVPEEKWPFPGFEALALRSTLYPSVIGTWGLEAAYTVDPLNLYSNELQSLTALLFRQRGPAGPSPTAPARWRRHGRRAARGGLPGAHAPGGISHPDGGTPAPLSRPRPDAHGGRRERSAHRGGRGGAARRGRSRVRSPARGHPRRGRSARRVA